MDLQMNIGLSWSNVCSLLELFLALSLPCPFALPLLGALVAGLSSSRFLALEMGILDVLLEMSLGHKLQSAIVVFLVAECRLFSVDLQHILQFFRHFNLYLVQTLQHVVCALVSGCWWLLVPLCVEGLNVVVLWLDYWLNHWSARWLHCRHEFWRSRRQAISLLVRDLFSDWASPSAVVTCFSKFLVAILKSRFSKPGIVFFVTDSEVIRSPILLASWASPIHSISGFGKSKKLTDFALKAHVPTSEWCSPLVNHNLLGFYLFTSCIITRCDCWRLSSP